MVKKIMHLIAVFFVIGTVLSHYTVQSCRNVAGRRVCKTTYYLKVDARDGVHNCAVSHYVYNAYANGDTIQVRNCK